MKCPSRFPDAAFIVLKTKRWLVLYKIISNKKSVAFVCVGNACRSQIAEAWARHLGGDAWEVFSAGSRPAGFVAPEVGTVMSEVKIDTKNQFSKGVDSLPEKMWDYVISMGCGDACLHLPAKKRYDWPIPDPIGRDLNFFREVRDELKTRVTNLLNQGEL